MEGQLGYGQLTTVLAPRDVGYVPGAQNVIAIAAGSSHTCAVYNNMKLKCWGSNSYGQLGYGDTDAVYEPESVDFISTDSDVSAVDCGYHHTCAIFSMGRMKCWGRGTEGQLGYGDTNGVSAPSSVGYISVGDTVISIAAGGAHTCAVIQGGSLKCWGSSWFGQLGYGNTNTILSPALVPSIIVGGSVHTVVADMQHTCVRLTSGGMKCWGSGANGRLGYASVNNVLTPSDERDIATNGAVKSIAVGADHTCALLTSGPLQCWGRGDRGQLGYGIISSLTSPGSLIQYTNAAAGHTADDQDITMLAAGGAHNCIVFAAGFVRCWGVGEVGQLGQGSKSSISDATAAKRVYFGTRAALTRAYTAINGPNDGLLVLQGTGMDLM